jgi:hypothetical protein
LNSNEINFKIVLRLIRNNLLFQGILAAIVASMLAGIVVIFEAQPAKFLNEKTLMLFSATVPLIGFLFIIIRVDLKERTPFTPKEKISVLDINDLYFDALKYPLMVVHVYYLLLCLFFFALLYAIHKLLGTNDLETASEVVFIISIILTKFCAPSVVSQVQKIFRFKRI